VDRAGTRTVTTAVDRRGTMSPMPMREGCKHFESRTYPSGDTVRKCGLDLAPEAPWRCPDECAAYTPRLADVNWSHGSLVTPPTPPEPESVSAGDPTVGALLDEAEDIVNRVAAETRRDVEDERRRKGGLFRRFKRGK
jgi:hypothetical protein